MGAVQLPRMLSSSCKSHFCLELFIEGERMCRRVHLVYLHIPNIPRSAAPRSRKRIQLTLEQCGVRVPDPCTLQSSCIAFDSLPPPQPAPNLTTNSLLLTGSPTDNINGRLTHIVRVTGVMYCISQQSKLEKGQRCQENAKGENIRSHSDLLEKPASKWPRALQTHVVRGSGVSRPQTLPGIRPSLPQDGGADHSPDL